MIELPKLYWRKTHIDSNIYFDEPITNNNCSDWCSCPYSELNTRALQRIDYLNNIQSKWKYKLLGWKIKDV